VPRKAGRKRTPPALRLTATLRKKLESVTCMIVVTALPYLLLAEKIGSLI